METLLTVTNIADRYVSRSPTRCAKGGWRPTPDTRHPTPDTLHPTPIVGCRRSPTPPFFATADHKKVILTTADHMKTLLTVTSIADRYVSRSPIRYVKVGLKPSNLIPAPYTLHPTPDTRHLTPDT